MHGNCVRAAPKGVYRTSPWQLSKYTKHTRAALRTNRGTCGLWTRRNDRNPPRNPVKCYPNIFSAESRPTGTPEGRLQFSSVAAAAVKGRAAVTVAAAILYAMLQRRSLRRTCDGREGQKKPK